MSLRKSNHDSKESQAHSDKSPRPEALAVRIDGIPESLKERDCWVVWRYTWKPAKNDKPGKWDKPPLCARTLKAASSTNPATWSTFEQAWAAYQRGNLDGVGFVLAAEEGSDPVLVGIDLDKCRDKDSGAIEPWAQDIIDQLKTVSEASPSGTGVRLLLFGRLPKDGRKKPYQSGIYENYETGRYVTITGCHLEGTPTTIESRQTELLKVHRQVWPDQYRQLSTAPPRRDGSLTDDEIIEKARQAKNGQRFRRLFDQGELSDYDNDDSRADLALCDMLAFYARTAERIDGLFRRSALMRDKWDRADYRQRTISKALAGRTEYYEPRGRPAERNGTASHSGVSRPKTEPPAPPSFALGPLTLQTGPPRRTPTKTTVPLLILRDGRMIDQFGLPTSITGRRLVAQQLASYLGADKARENIDAVLGEILAQAAQAPATARGEGQTLRTVVAEKVPEAMRFACRTKGGLWSEAVGDDVRRCDLVAYTPSWLVDAAGQAVDAPRDEEGAINRPALLRALQGELGILWADLLTSLPREAEVDLGRDTERGRQFRQAMIRLWKTPLTWEKISSPNGDTATRASLASRVYSQFSKTRTSSRIAWEAVHPACDAWWRPHMIEGGELRPLLAMRWTLPGQVGIDLPGVTSEESLTRLGTRFGVIADPLPGVPSRLSGGTHRLAVLTLELCEELLETPNEDPEDNSREPGAEG